MNLDALPRFSLVSLPTPLHELSRLSQRLRGPQLLVKRDDLTGLAFGGNKARKLEFLIGDALSAGADTVVTAGASQSNHCRQTAAAAASVGMRCILVLRGDPPAGCTGNILLDRLLGAELRFSGQRSREEVMDEIVASELKQGRNPYPIPLGGSNALGAVAFALAVEELLWQTDVRFDRIIFASSSGGTQAGLIAGAHLLGFHGQILGISVDEPLERLKEIVAPVARETIRLFGGSAAIGIAEVDASADYLGGGYGVLGAPEREAIRLFARSEGILLDPVYTGRAAAGMIDMIRRGVIGKDEVILFWHTGGTPALWAYADELLV